MFEQLAAEASSLARGDDQTIFWAAVVAVTVALIAIGTAAGWLAWDSRRRPQ